jgi:hypothetical protein
MKDLEKMIKDRREEFDIAEPDQGHLERFRSKLPRNDRRNFEILRIAAIIVAAAFVSLSSYIYLNVESPEEAVTFMPTEVEEAIYYYQSLNWEKENQIMSIPINDSEEKSNIQNDLNNYDEQYKQLMKDLKNFPNDQRVIDAIIEYHRSKSEMLEHILYQLQQKQI